MADFNKIIGEILKSEGGYVNNKNDAGGETNFGITKAVAVANGYSGSMKDLSLDFAKKIYKNEYWDKLKLDQVRNQEVAEILFDVAVNAGVGRAAEFMQKMINYMTKSNIEIDRKIGNITIGKINEIDTSKEAELATMLLATLQGAHYITCCDKREANEDFLLGWLRRYRKNLQKSLKFA